MDWVASLTRDKALAYSKCAVHSWCFVLALHLPVRCAVLLLKHSFVNMWNHLLILPCGPPALDAF